MTRSLITPLLLAVLALGAAGCGGDDDASADPAEPTSSTDAVDEPSGSGSPTDPGGAASSGDPSVSVPPAPGDESEDGVEDDFDEVAVIASMQGSLDALVDPKTTPQQKADRIVGGRDLASVFGQFQQSSGDSQLVFTVAEPEVQGRRATALVGASDRGRQYAAPARTPFVLEDGEWRLERSTVCAFAEQAGLRCPRR